MICKNCDTPMSLLEPLTPRMCRPDIDTSRVRLTYQCSDCLDEYEDTLIVPRIQAKAVRNALREIERALWWKAARDKAVMDFDDKMGCFVMIPESKSSYASIMRSNLLRSFAVLQDMDALRIVARRPIKLEIYVLGYVLAVHNP